MINRTIKIAYIFENFPEGGGNFQTEITTANRLKKISSNNIEFKFYSTNKNNLEVLKKYNFDVKFLKKKNIDLNIIKIKNTSTNKILKNLINLIFQSDTFEKTLLSDSIDLVHFNSMSPSALLLNKIDYGISFWDMAHLDYPMFPESKNNFHSIEAREYIFKTLADKSSYIITDSMENKTNFSKRYNTNKNKIHLIYSEPSFQILNNISDANYENNILKKLNIEIEKFIFYPAQYWSHKNHVYILEALSYLKNEHNKIITAIFCGSNKNNLEYLQTTAKNLNNFENIKFLDFLSEQEIYSLYKNCLAIAVPTYFGPTNHLPIEGFYFEKPVLYSNIWADTEQVKDAVIPIDLKNPKDLAEKLMKLSSDISYKETYQIKARDKYIELNKKIKNNEIILDKIFQNYKTLKKTFRS